jgi:hypothetical protein
MVMGSASYSMATQWWIDFNGDGTFQTTESVGGNATAQFVVTSTGANILGTANIVGNVTIGANITATGYMIQSVATGISAGGGIQPNAVPLTTDISVVSTVSTGTGVLLPTAVAGMMLTIINTSANSLLVYPAIGGIINSQAVNAAFTQTAGNRLQYVATTGTQWYTV